ncbi:AMP-binding protein, partial [Streptomyces sp. NPDC001274]
MDPKTSAHLDTFAREHLPPRDEWPDLLFGLPALRYPDRLNCAVELLDRTAERFGPDRPALRSGDGAVWSYRELRERVDRIAHVLTSDLGVVPGNRVLLRGPTGPRLAACWLAVLKAGAIAVTVLDRQRPGELSTICSLARIGHALCDARSVDDLLRARVPG